MRSKGHRASDELPANYHKKTLRPKLTWAETTVAGELHVLGNSSFSINKIAANNVKITRRTLSQTSMMPPGFPAEYTSTFKFVYLKLSFLVSIYTARCIKIDITQYSV